MESAYLSDPSSLTNCRFYLHSQPIVPPLALENNCWSLSVYSHRIALVRELCVVVAGCVPHHWTRPIAFSQ